MGKRLKNFVSLDKLPRRPDTDDFPMWCYQELATAGVKYCVAEYISALCFVDVTFERDMEVLKHKTGRKADLDRQRLEDKRITLEDEAEACMRFFESERFDILMPGTDKQWFIDTVEERAQTRIREMRGS